MKAHGWHPLIGSTTANGTPLFQVATTTALSTTHSTCDWGNSLYEQAQKWTNLGVVRGRPRIDHINLCKQGVTLGGVGDIEGRPVAEITSPPRQ